MIPQPTQMTNGELLGLLIALSLVVIPIGLGIYKKFKERGGDCE